MPLSSQKGTSKAAFLAAAQQELARMSGMEVKGLKMSNLHVTDAAI